MTNEIRLLQVDGKYPNLALMKLSAWHKRYGDNVDWYIPVRDRQIDRLYISKIFNFTSDAKYLPDCEIIRGGTGYNELTKLPEEVEEMNILDYSLYPNCDYSIQYFSRGCINKCPFCIVPVKEGSIRSVEPMKLNPNGKHVKILDNNFFANKRWREAISQIKAWNQPVSFESGIDARILTEEQANVINSLKMTGRLHIAWDNPRQDLLPKLKQITQWIKPWKITCYVLIGYWSTPEEDMYRVEKLRELGISPYVMPFKKADSYQKRFARWVNHKAVFNSVAWGDYKW